MNYYLVAINRSLQLFLMIFLTSNSMNDQEKHPSDSTENRKLVLELHTSATEFNYSERNMFQISIHANNSGKTIIEPDLYFTSLLINGIESEVWRHAITNGRRKANWYFLPPGEKASMSWSTMGDQLFPVPGEYILQLQLRSIKSNQVKIIVLND